MSEIVLATLNARYIHTAFGLRYLYANLGELQSRSMIMEFTIHQRPLDVAEKLLDQNPSIIGFGVYIWNVEQISQVVVILKQITPQIIIVLGGPEVSHGNDLPAMAESVDYIVQGAGEVALSDLCRQILSGQQSSINTFPVIIKAADISLAQLELPYRFYNDEDIQNRLIYVEASRGCPFKCEFCLSSLDKTSRPFELARFLREMDNLYQRGARNFKFIDRTFNLKVNTSVSILEFFLQRLSDDLYLHFEVIPDNLPDRLKAVISRFPRHSLQFEIGVQTFDPQIQQRISRRQDNEKTRANLRWLKQYTQAYIHADLIFGLPGDTLENFAQSFDQLVALQPDEIQLGILKRLRGAPINRHNEAYQLKYNPQAPYNILSTSLISYKTMQRVNRFAFYWDRIANSGRFPHCLPLILQQQAFNNFLTFSDAIYDIIGNNWKISLKRWFILINNWLEQSESVTEQQRLSALERDYQHSGERAALHTLIEQTENGKTVRKSKIGVANKRQQRQITGSGSG